MQDRPVDATPRHTAELPATPRRDCAIEADAWIEAPAALVHLGDDLGTGRARYLRRIGPWLLWRTGPPSRGRARYWAGHAEHPEVAHMFNLHPDGDGDGTGPSGRRHERFREWKEDLRDHP